MPNVFIGTSGFSYHHWRGNFYPQDLPQNEWFLYYTKYFDTVEINTTFYRQIKKETFIKWRKIAGQNFVFALKGNRFITHIKKLKNCQKEVERFFEVAKGLETQVSLFSKTRAKVSVKSKQNTHLLSELPIRNINTKSKLSLTTGQYFSKRMSSTSLNVVLWQLPPGMAFDKFRLKKFLAILPETFRHAFEFRNKSWRTEEAFSLLRKFNAVVVFQDYPDWPMTEEVTADFVYLRFHGRTSLYSSCYTKKELSLWAEKIKKWLGQGKDVYAYFNNDALGYAVENAQTLKKIMFKKEILSHLFVTLTWLIIITLLRWNWHLPAGRQVGDLIWLCLGGLLGTYLFDLDHFLYLLFIYPHELTSQRFQRLLEQKRFKEAFFLVNQTASERIRLPFHNALFQIINFVLCFFVLTSTDNLFVKGLVMAMSLHLLKDEIGEILGGQKERLKRWLFWQLKFEISFEGQKIYLIVMVLIFLVLNWLLI